MNKLLSTTAIVGVLALFAGPALAGHNVDVVLNGQLNLYSATSATGVVAGGKYVNISVNDVDVQAIGNLNDTVANGGGSVFTLNSDSTYNSDGSHFDFSYEKTVQDGGDSVSYGTHTSLSVSGSAWSHSSTHNFGLTKTRTNRVFVGSLQANIGSPTTAIGIDAGGMIVKVAARNLTVTAVGNMNSTNLTGLSQ